MRDDGSPNESYREDDLLVRLQRTLGITDTNLDELTRDDLSTVEEFHLGGRRATRDLADMAGLEPGDRVLDVGCGIGGPARTLAAEYDCEVLGLDRANSYPRVARWLSDRVGLADQVHFVAGNATALPVADAEIDAVWLQHAGMNVAEKDQLFAESLRVIRPGGILAIHEVCAGSGESPRFPVPWATDGTGSHLLAPDKLGDVATAAGFERQSWTDVTDNSLAQVRAAIAARDCGDAGTSVVDLLVDADSEAVFENLETNLDDGRISVVMSVFQRPSNTN